MVKEHVGLTVTDAGRLLPQQNYASLNEKCKQNTAQAQAIELIWAFRTAKLFQGIRTAQQVQAQEMGL